MRDYLENRDQLYIVDQSLLSSLSDYNDPIQIQKGIQRTLAIIESIKTNIELMDSYSKEADETFRTIVDGLNAKISSMTNKIDAYRSNLAIIRNGGSVNIINLEDCKYINTAYSSNDAGIILES